LRAVSLGYVGLVRSLTPPGRPAPLRVFTGARRLIPVADALAPRSGSTARSTAQLHDRWLAEHLGETIGIWSLHVATVNFLSRRMLVARPRAILEFGSGVSTLCFAHWARELHGADRCSVVAIEQEATFAERTTGLLRQFGLEGVATVVHAPLGNVTVLGRPFVCYLLDVERIVRLLAGPAELVLVDGPSAGSGGSRFATLPIARAALAEGATVFLDDALRDGELAVAQQWERLLPWLRVRGIHPFGKGLLEAVVEPREPSATLSTIASPDTPR
jgi:predicted O-methyltransferase YrrM